MSSTDVDQSGRQDGRFPKIRTVPALFRKEILAALVSLAVLCMLSALGDAPVDGPANPRGIPADQVKAPWIFVGIQQLLKWWPPFIAGVILPGLALAVLACIPYLPSGSPGLRRFVQVLFFGLILVSLALTVGGYLS